MLIQRATKSDASMTVKLIKALLDELDGKPVTWDIDKAERLCKRMIEMEDYVVFLLVNNGQTVGLITIAETESLYAGGKIGLIQELYIAPSMRSQKLGQSLIQKAIEFASGKKWRRLEVGAPDYPRWSRTKAFYVREGFYEIGPRLKYVL
ncbi:MAG: GNAT family N-acetyltransferase [Planctomycetota bacterium]|jgi:GNAT superfamily N-acetyltransferase